MRIGLSTCLVHFFNDSSPRWNPNLAWKASPLWCLLLCLAYLRLILGLSPVISLAVLKALAAHCFKTAYFCCCLGLVELFKITGRQTLNLDTVTYQLCDLGPRLECSAFFVLLTEVFKDWTWLLLERPCWHLNASTLLTISFLALYILLLAFSLVSLLPAFIIFKKHTFRNRLAWSFYGLLSMDSGQGCGLSVLGFYMLAACISFPCSCGFAPASMPCLLPVGYFLFFK